MKHKYTTGSAMHWTMQIAETYLLFNNFYGRRLRFVYAIAYHSNSRKILRKKENCSCAHISFECLSCA